MSLRNWRYERFAHGLAEGKPAYQAYIDAGFAKAGAAQLRARPDCFKSQRAGIRERVAEILQERQHIDAAGTQLAIERTAIDKEWVIERLRENVERAMQAQPVIDRAGHPTGSYVYNGAAANRALELLGKELGMFIERREHKIVDEWTCVVLVERHWVNRRPVFRTVPGLRSRGPNGAGRDCRTRRCSGRWPGWLPGGCRRSSARQARI